MSDDAVTIELPGTFAATFSGGGIAHGDRTQPGERALGDAWDTRVTRRRGRGTSVCLTIAREYAIEALRSLHLNAEVAEIGAEDALEGAYHRHERFAALAERTAARKVQERVQAALVELEHN